MSGAAADRGAPRPIRHIFRWDLDKTYLRTDFDSLRALFRTAIERASDKQAVPGAAALLRELHAAGPDGAHRICFVSGSPRQMRKVLTEKLRLDGVEFDEFILKPNLSNLLRGRFRALREQVGYKLPALLAGRHGVGPEVGETLFGDDAESDAIIYSLYADLMSGYVTYEHLERMLKSSRVYPDDQKRTLGLLRGVTRTDGVRRILILLDRHSPPAKFDAFGARLVPVFNYFQAALVLCQDGTLDCGAVLRVAETMVSRFDYAPDALVNSAQDLLRRGRLRPETALRFSGEVRDSLPALEASSSSRQALRLMQARLEAAAGSTRAALRPGELSVDYASVLGLLRRAAKQKE